MGIAVFVVYMPILLLLTAVAAGVGIKGYMADHARLLEPWKSVTFMAVGASLSSALTIFAASRIVHVNNTDFEALFKQIAISLLLPISIGLVVMGIAMVLRRMSGRVLVALIANRLGIGALHSVWLLPVALLAYMEVTVG